MTLGTCQRREWLRKRARGETIPWDSTDKTTMRDEAHTKARVLCASCPVLEACEAYLAAMERAGISVAGVVAGRYSDLPSSGVRSTAPKSLPRASATEQQTTCRGCGKRMWPQCTEPARIAVRPAPQHQGEGLCDVCWPDMHRFRRRVEEE